MIHSSEGRDPASDSEVLLYPDKFLDPYPDSDHPQNLMGRSLFKGLLLPK